MYQTWIGTDRGLALMTIPDGVWTTYSTANSPLPSDRITCIDVDAGGTVWIGTDAGVAALHGAEWTVYRHADSPLPDDRVTAILAAAGPAVWIGTTGGGAARFGPGGWQIFNTANSSLPSDHITAISEAWPAGALWFGTDRGLASFAQEKAAIVTAAELRERPPKVGWKMEPGR